MNSELSALSHQCYLAADTLQETFKFSTTSTHQTNVVVAKKVFEAGEKAAQRAETIIKERRAEKRAHEQVRKEARKVLGKGELPALDTENADRALAADT